MARAEEIVKAAIKHASVVDEAYRYAYQDGFIDGARWTDKENKAQKKENFVHLEDVWHDIKEEPEYGNTIVYVTKLNKIGTLKRVNNKNMFTWYIEKYTICQWAYLKDLLPKE